MASKRKLLVILGAGSYLGCGMPSVWDLNVCMKKWSSEWRSVPGFPEGAGEGVFNTLWDFVAGYYEQNPRRHLGIELNYEKILGEMIALASWTTPNPFGNVLRSAIKDGSPSDFFIWPAVRESDATGDTERCRARPERLAAGIRRRRKLTPLKS